VVLDLLFEFFSDNFFQKKNKEDRLGGIEVLDRPDPDFFKNLWASWG